MASVSHGVDRKKKQYNLPVQNERGEIREYYDYKGWMEKLIEDIKAKTGLQNPYSPEFQQILIDIGKEHERARTQDIAYYVEPYEVSPLIRTGRRAYSEY